MAGDRTEQATPHRREKARKEGDILVSRELTSAAAMLAGVLTLRMAAGQAAIAALLEALAGAPPLETHISAVFIGAAQWLLGRGNELPYVPYLALASAGVVVRWASVWDWGVPLFMLGWLIPAVLVVCLGLMAVLLWLMGLMTRR